MTTRYLGLAAVLFVHERMLQTFGGSPGLRDETALLSAIERPRATFSGQELYPGLLEKAAVLLESLCQNHPFVDGNKRVAYAAAGLFLENNGWRIDAPPDDATSFMLAVTSGTLHKEEIRIWLEGRSAPSVEH